jgi:5'-deoxynucleotidase YfbR-like HD superfamily hydrolase
MSNYPYFLTFLGNKFYPHEPRIEKIEIEDIAHGLAYQSRFNGQTSEFYSIAQHSLIVSSIVSPRLKLAALLHDASEAYLGDMIKPLKIIIDEFNRIEEKVAKLIFSEFNIPTFDYTLVKNADLITLATEIRDLIPHSVKFWDDLDNIEALPKKIKPISPLEAKNKFLREFYYLNSCSNQ